MKEPIKTENIYVNSEIGHLRRILIHRPDLGIGKIIPSKFQDWMYDDIVHLPSMKKEYDEYIKILLYFLDPDKITFISDTEKKCEDNGEDTDCLNPSHPNYFNSNKVVDVQRELSRLLPKSSSNGQPNLVRNKLIAAICAIEECSYEVELQLQELEPEELAKTFITGLLPQDLSTPDINKFLFAPVPNLVFTRDIGIVIQDHYILSKACKKARKRESLLTKFIAYYSFFLYDQRKVIEITDDSAFFLLSKKEQNRKKVSLEGGDVMMISPGHILIGCSERTTANAVNNFIHKIFGTPGLEVDLISVIKIPRTREQMHIDTIFTQVKRNVWVLFGQFSEVLQAEKNNGQVDYLGKLAYDKRENVIAETQIFQFYKQKFGNGYHPEQNYLLQTDADYAILNQDLALKNFPPLASKPRGLEHLLRLISTIEFKVPADDVVIIYSGSGIFPDDAREQWTDSCNLLALREGVVIGYDRNSITNEEFRNAFVNHYRRQGKMLPAGMPKGFSVITATELIQKFESGELKPEEVKDTLIELSSEELSRARGGSRCMSQPLLRDPLKI